ncbi:MAG: hypothetical protein P1U32_04800 [Legionellaceae bacterium]|nr:hypothetical protein [Legionellaceae bacterium]
MQKIIHKKILCISLYAMCTGYGYAASNNNNPASIGYVDKAVVAAVDEAVKKSAYTAGTAISIINNVISGNYTAGTGIRIDNGSVIVATGATESYQGTGAIDVSSAIISARFSGTNGIYVPSDGSGDNTGTIQGPLAGTGLNLASSTTGPGTLNLDTQYAAGSGITFTESGSGSTTTTTISVTSASTLEIGQLHEGGVIIYLDSSGEHGLAIATADQTSSAVQFSEHSKEFSVGNGIGAGLINTAIVVGHADDNNENSAPYKSTVWYVDGSGTQTSSCEPSTVFPPNSITCYGGWHMASLYEWEYVYYNYDAIQTGLQANGSPLLEGSSYWTSTVSVSGDDNHERAYRITFSGATTEPSIDTGNLQNGNAYVRSVRQF